MWLAILLKSYYKIKGIKLVYLSWLITFLHVILFLIYLITIVWLFLVLYNYFILNHVITFHDQNYQEPTYMQI